MPIVRGEGPREEPKDAEALKVMLFRLGTLSARSMRLGSGVWRPVGRAVAVDERPDRARGGGGPGSKGALVGVWERILAGRTGGEGSLRTDGLTLKLCSLALPEEEKIFM